jgi:hypothetical protein
MNASFVVDNTNDQERENGPTHLLPMLEEVDD